MSAYRNGGRGCNALAAISLLHCTITRKATETTIWRRANDANRDHLSATDEKIGVLHQRVVGTETRMFHGKPHAR